MENLSKRERLAAQFASAYIGTSRAEVSAAMIAESACEMADTVLRKSETADSKVDVFPRWLVVMLLRWLSGKPGDEFGVSLGDESVATAKLDMFLKAWSGRKLVPIPQPDDTPLPDGVVVVGRTLQDCKDTGCQSANNPKHGCNKLREEYICPYCSKQRAALKRAGGVYVACAPCKSWFRIA